MIKFKKSLKKSQFLRTRRVLNSIFVTFFIFIKIKAFAVVETEISPKSENSSKSATFASSSSTARQGAYQTIDFDPAGLRENRVRLSTEYIIIDGFSFGGQIEFDKSKNRDFTQQTMLIGIAAAQYFQSQSLKGIFVRGEFSPYVTALDNYTQEEPIRNYLIGLTLGADLGYRFNLGKTWTSAASYGVRKNLPDFFKSVSQKNKENFEALKNVWDFRIALTLGVAI